MEQQEDRLNIALLSPNENTYSETFIHAHKNLISAKVFFYYGGAIPRFLEGRGHLDAEPGLLGILRRRLGVSRSAAAPIGVYALRESLLRNRIDVVLAEFCVTAAESLPAIRDAGIPLVVHFHGFDAHNRDVINHYRERYKEVFAYAHKVIVVSEHMKRQVVSLGCPNNKIVYTVYGPHAEFFDVNSTFTTQQFLAVGRFVDKKAPYYTILAFSGVLKEFPNASLKMAADGALLSMCKNLTRYLKIQSSVQFIGVASRDTIREEMARSIAFVQHSIVAENGDSEGTPVAIIESGAAGLPVIATRHAGIVDVVVEGQTGILVDEHDVSGMTSAMKVLLGEPSFARQLGASARKRIQKSFSMERHISTIEEALADSSRDHRRSSVTSCSTKGTVAGYRQRIGSAIRHRCCRNPTSKGGNTRLVMTILARNEDDVIRENIEFHLRHGVDFIIATDNGSVDTTREILKEYEEKGKLFLIDEPGRDKSQASWNNRMTKLAMERYGADIVFHCDADEFWFPESGNLKSELSESSADVLIVKLVNILLENRDGDEIFPRDAKYAVVKPIASGNFEVDSRGENLYLFEYPPKVMFKTKKGFLEVTQGNHAVASAQGNIREKTSSSIRIFHVPLRGRSRFYRKVVENGEAVEKNALLDKGTSWHIRRWFEAYKDGTLAAEYAKLTISAEKAADMKRDGLIEDFDFQDFLNT